MLHSKADAVPIVTLRTLLGVELPGLEAHLDRVQQEIIGRYKGILEKLQQETARTSSNVLITVQDRETSLLQSGIAEGGDTGPPLPAGGFEAQFGGGLTGGDVWRWIRSLFDHIDETQWHPIMRPPDNKAGNVADEGHLAVVGDWGTNLYGAPDLRRLYQADRRL